MVNCPDGVCSARLNQTLVVSVHVFCPSPKEENSARFSPSVSAGGARTKISDSILTQAGNNEKEGALFLWRK